MNAYTFFLSVLSSIALSSCGNVDAPSPQIEEQIFINANIYTVDSNQVWAESMLVKSGFITAIGTNEDVQALASSAAVVSDLRGKMVMPGIHDVHVHPLEAASDNFQFVLDVLETNAENYAPDIRKALKDFSETRWLLGWGFDIYALLDASRSPLAILNEISADRPIVIMEQTSHSVWANSMALELAGFNSNSADPEGGVIMKDELGNPNGLLIDNAGNLLVDMAVNSIPGNEEKDYEGLVFFALPELARNGITSICDARAYWKRNHHMTWQRVADEGKLTVRTNLGLWVYPTENDDLQINTLKSLYANEVNSLLRINQIKLYADGIVVNTTAALHTDYHVDLFERSTNNGLNYISQDRMEAYIKALEPVGFDFHIHAIGDRGVHEALNAIEMTGSTSGRHRLTHVEYVTPSDYDRFATLNVTADAQVAGDFANPENWHETDDLVGHELNENIIPIKSLLEAKTRVTLSSDWDVSELNPFIGIQNAVTRSPQNITLEEAIKSYTINAAYVMRQENQVGSLEVGKEADFIILDQNIFEIDPSLISQTKVLQTYLKGNLIYNN